MAPAAVSAEASATVAFVATSVDLSLTLVEPLGIESTTGILDVVRGKYKVPCSCYDSLKYERSIPERHRKPLKSKSKPEVHYEI